jgi:hypothetical protein
MLWNGLRELPSTNYRIFVSVAMEILFVVVILACIVVGKTIPIDVVWALGLLITAWLGLGVAQFANARKTDIDYVNAQNAAAPSVTVEAPSQVTVAPAVASPASPAPVQISAPAAPAAPINPNVPDAGAPPVDAGPSAPSLASPFAPPQSPAAAPLALRLSKRNERGAER